MWQRANRASCASKNPPVPTRGQCADNSGMWVHLILFRNKAWETHRCTFLQRCSFCTDLACSSMAGHAVQMLACSLSLVFHLPTFIEIILDSEWQQDIDILCWVCVCVYRCMYECILRMCVDMHMCVEARGYTAIPQGSYIFFLEMVSLMNWAAWPVNSRDLPFLSSSLTCYHTWFFIWRLWVEAMPHLCMASTSLTELASF